jgi:hypothetical protein
MQPRRKRRRGQGCHTTCKQHRNQTKQSKVQLQPPTTARRPKARLKGKLTGFTRACNLVRAIVQSGSSRPHHILLYWGQLPPTLRRVPHQQRQGRTHPQACIPSLLFLIVLPQPGILKLGKGALATKHYAAQQLLLQAVQMGARSSVGQLSFDCCPTTHQSMFNAL